MWNLQIIFVLQLIEKFLDILFVLQKLYMYIKYKLIYSRLHYNGHFFYLKSGTKVAFFHSYTIFLI